jgi:hypothetical protein
VVKASAWSLLKDRQILLFCLIYFCIQLTIYAATFWLPSIIKRMGDLSDLQVGFFNSIPWLISIIAMYAFAAGSGAGSSSRPGWRRRCWWRLGMFMSTTGGPVFAFVAVCFAAIGFKSASSLFWPIPQGYLDARIAAAVIALINSVGNLGGFVAPTTFGLLEQQTGSIQGGLYGLAVTSVVAAIAVFFVRTRAKGALPMTSRPLGPGPETDDCETTHMNMQTLHTSTPVVTDLRVVPVAGHDSMLLNLSGAHGPYFTRNVVVLRDSAGNTGLGEVPGGEDSPDPGRRPQPGGRPADRPLPARAQCHAPDLRRPRPAGAACRPSTCASPCMR